MKPSILTFDIGSTLIHPNFVALREWVGEHTGIRTDAATVEYAFRRALAGDVFSANNGEDAAALRFFSFIGCASTTKVLWLDWWASIVRSGGAGSWLYTVLDPQAHETLRTLKDSGWRLVAASNSDGTLRAELTAFGLIEFFEATYDSHDIGVAKPEPEFYRYVLNDIGGSRAVHIGDDLLKDVLGPLASGFSSAILFDPANIYKGTPPGARIAQLADLIGTLDRIA